MKDKIKNWWRDKKGVTRNVLIMLLIALAVLVISVIVMVILKGKGDAAIDFIKNLFRFRK